MYVTSLITQGDGKTVKETATASQITSSADADVNGDSHARPVGPLAGGAAGGIAALVAIIIIAFLFLRRRKRQGHQDPYLSLYDNFDAIYKKRVLKSDKTSELEGSTPDLPAMLDDTGCRGRYEIPGDIRR